MRNSHLSEPFHQLAIHQTCQVCHTSNAIRCIHCEYVHIFPSHILHFAFQPSANHSSIVQGQDSSSGLSQGTTLCRTMGLRLPPLGTCPLQVLSLHLGFIQNTLGITRSHQTRFQFFKRQSTKPTPNIQRRGAHTCLRKHKRGRISFCP